MKNKDIDKKEVLSKHMYHDELAGTVRLNIMAGITNLKQTEDKDEWYYAILIVSGQPIYSTPTKDKDMVIKSRAMVTKAFDAEDRYQRRQASKLMKQINKNKIIKANKYIELKLAKQEKKIKKIQRKLLKKDKRWHNFTC